MAASDRLTELCGMIAIARAGTVAGAAVKLRRLLAGLEDKNYRDLSIRLLTTALMAVEQHTGSGK